MSTKNRGKRKRHVFRTWVTGQTAAIVTPVLCSRAKVVVETTIRELDVRNGRPGLPVACAIHHSCVARNPFPHPAFHVEVSRSRVAVVDKVEKRTGRWVHCFVYAHNKADWTRQFDRPGGKAKLLKAWDGDEKVILSPPPADEYRPGRARGKNDGSRSTVSPTIKKHKKGLDRRWCDACGPVVAAA